METAISVPDEVLRNLINSNPMEIELRGYEVAQYLGDSTNHTWDVVGKYRPSERGRLDALAHCVWLQGRHVNETYRVRPIISLEPPQQEATNGVIVTPPPAEQKALPAPAGDIP